MAGLASARANRRRAKRENVRCWQRQNVFLRISCRRVAREVGYRILRKVNRCAGCFTRCGAGVSCTGARISPKKANNMHERTALSGAEEVAAAAEAVGFAANVQSALLVSGVPHGPVQHYLTNHHVHIHSPCVLGRL